MGRRQVEAASLPTRSVRVHSLLPFSPSSGSGTGGSPRDYCRIRGLYPGKQKTERSVLHKMYGIDIGWAVENAQWN